jgi:hypothetical protein
VERTPSSLEASLSRNLKDAAARTAGLFDGVTVFVSRGGLPSDVLAAAKERGMDWQLF